jgi:hypothetical protein
VYNFLRDWLNAKGFRVVEEGSMSGQDLILKFNRQYAELGRRAVILKPHEYTLTTLALIQFQKRFGVGWSEAIEQGLVRNATDAAALLDISVEELYEEWLKSQKNDNVLKFDRGFFCGLIDTVPDKPAIFCVNGFYPSMRAQYASPSSTIRYCSVEWESNISWESFRMDLIGCSDPAASPKDSIRHILQQEWRELGLEFMPDIRDNCVHVSASAFEAFTERCNWLGEAWMSDPLGSRLFGLGLTPHIISDWVENSVVKGKKVFDHMENLGCQQCLDRAKEIFSIADGMCRVLIANISHQTYYCFYVQFSGPFFSSSFRRDGSDKTKSCSKANQDEYCLCIFQTTCEHGQRYFTRSRLVQ